MKSSVRRLDSLPRRSSIPTRLTSLTPLGHLYGLIALATFLALDGPLALVRGLWRATTFCPPEVWH